MDLSGLPLFDPILIDSVRDTLAAARDHFAGAAYAWAPQSDDYGGDAAPGLGGEGGLELAQATPEKPAENPGEKPSTTPPEKRVMEGSLERKDAPGAGGPSAAGIDFSVWGIVARADPIAKVVIAILSVASVWS